MPTGKKGTKKTKKAKTLRKAKKLEPTKPLLIIDYGDIKGESTDKDHKDWVS